MRRSTIDRIDTIQFDSFTEFVQFCEKNKGKSACFNTSSEDISNNDTKWTGSTSLPAALKLAVGGWDAGTKLVKNILDKKEVIGKGYTFSPRYDTAGESVDIGRFLSGEPENMIEWEMVETTGHKVIDLYYNCCASSSYSKECLMRYGAAALSILDYLESCGIRVNLYVYESIIGDAGEEKLIIVKVKTADESLSLPTCAFALAHPSMLRRLMFKVMEVVPGFYLSEYGMPKEFDKKRWAGEKDAVIFQTINNTRMRWDSDDDITRFLKTKLPEVLNSLEISLETDFSNI